MAGPARRAKLEALELAEVERVRLDRGALERLSGHGDPALDREGEAEAVVVVGVLADQVDPSGSERLDTPPFVEACSRQMFEWRIGRSILGSLGDRGAALGPGLP